MIEFYDFCLIQSEKYLYFVIYLDGFVKIKLVGTNDYTCVEIKISSTDWRWNRRKRYKTCGLPLYIEYIDSFICYNEWHQAKNLMEYHDLAQKYLHTIKQSNYNSDQAKVSRNAGRKKKKQSCNTCEQSFKSSTKISFLAQYILTVGQQTGVESSMNSVSQEESESTVANFMEDV